MNIIITQKKTKAILMEYNIKRADNWNINKLDEEYLGSWTYVEIVELQWDLKKNEEASRFSRW